MAADYYSQEHMFRCDLSIEEPANSGTYVTIPESFDKFDGGEVTSEGASTYSAGGMVTPTAIAGVPTTGEIKVARGYKPGRDAALKKWIQARMNHRCKLGVQALAGGAAVVVGGLDTYLGLVTGCTTPQFDSNGQSVTVFEVAITPDGLPS